MKDSLDQLARSLADAWRAGRTIPLPAADAAPRSREEAFAVQDRMAVLLGDRVAGWKVGATVRAVQILEGHDGPIPGRLFASRVFTSPAEVPASLFGGYKIECEFAFRFREALAARRTPFTRAEIEPLLVFHPGLEVAGTRYAAGSAGRRPTTHDAIADNGTGGAYVLADALADWRGIDFERLPIDARIDGGDAIQVYTGDYRRDPVDIVVETVNDLSARGIGLAAGDLLSTGSLTLPTPLSRGQTYVARFGDLQTLRVSMR